MKVITIQFPFQLFHFGRYLDVIINGKPVGTVPNGGSKRFVVASENLDIATRYSVYHSEPVKLNLVGKNTASLKVGTFRSNLQAILSFGFGAALCWFRDSVNVYLAVAALSYVVYMVYFTVLNKKHFLYVKEV